MPWKECHVEDERLRFVARRWTARIDDRALRGVRDLPEDRLQDLRPLQGLRRPRADGPQPAAVPARQPAPAGDRNADRPAEEGLSGLGRAQDPREAARPVRAAAVPGHQHRARRPRSARPGAAAQAPPTPRDRHAALPDRPRPMRCGVPTTKASFGSATGGTAIRSRSPTSPAATCSPAKRSRRRASSTPSPSSSGPSRTSGCRARSGPTTACPSPPRTRSTG